MAVQKLGPQKPTGAFIGASWLALIIGVGGYIVGLVNADVDLIYKGFYLTVLLFGLFSVVSVQKSVRDRTEGVPVTGIYYGIAWICLLLALVLLSVGLWNSEMVLHEKGYYAVTMVLSLFAAIAVQKNVRDLATFADEPKPVSDYAEPSWSEVEARD